MGYRVGDPHYDAIAMPLGSHRRKCQEISGAEELAWMADGRNGPSECAALVQRSGRRDAALLVRIARRGDDPPEQLQPQKNWQSWNHQEQEPPVPGS